MWIPPGMHPFWRLTTALFECVGSPNKYWRSELLQLTKIISHDQNCLSGRLTTESPPLCLSQQLGFSQEAWGPFYFGKTMYYFDEGCSDLMFPSLRETICHPCTIDNIETRNNQSLLQGWQWIHFCLRKRKLKESKQLKQDHRAKKVA